MSARRGDRSMKRSATTWITSEARCSLSLIHIWPDWERRLEMKGWTRGDNEALVRFIAPAKDAGNATLKLGDGAWVFNPKLNQVIKLPGSMMSQSWMGSDFSYNDLSKSEDIITDYTHRLTATAQADGHTVWTLSLIHIYGRALSHIHTNDNVNL